MDLRESARKRGNSDSAPLRSDDVAGLPVRGWAS